jgi:hypothetical protein
MQSISEVLKREIERREVAVPTDDQVFELLNNEACSQCCEEHSGGNGTCPPPKWELAE